MLTLSRIAFRHFTTKYTYGLISFTSLISIIGLTLGVASMLIVDSFTNGFSETIESKLAAIDGHIRISKFESSLTKGISPREFSYIDSTLNTISQISNSSQYISNNGFVKRQDVMEGVFVYGVENEALDNIFTINQFLTAGINNFKTPNDIIIGKKLAEILNVEIGSGIHLFDMEPLIEKGLFNSRKFHVIGIISTGFPEYDQVLAFIPIDIAKEIFSYKDNITGVIVNLDNKNDISIILNNLNESFRYYPYNINSWKERHITLYNWLQVYHVPIQLVIIFVTILAICNIGVTLWMLVLEKTNEIGIMKSIGFTKNMISKIFMYQGIYIGVIGAISGTLLGILITALQNKFHFITLSADVYFIDHLPAILNWEQVIINIIITLILTIIMSVIPALRAANTTPIEALNYE